jgi:hypothetical protein
MNRNQGISMKEAEFENITLIVSQNDLESQTIIRIARELGFSDIRVSQQSWGAQLEKEPEENLANLKNEIWIIEIPGPAMENRLQYEGHKLFIIDHHCYENFDRWNEKSSLEQFAEKCEYNLNLEEKWIAINDRGYLWELADADVPFEDIQRIRRLDYSAQGWTEKDIEDNQAEFDLIKDRIDDHVRLNNRVFVHQTRLEKTGYLVEQFHMPDVAHYQMYRKSDMHRPYCRENLLLIHDSPTPSLFFSGTIGNRNLLLWHCYWPRMKYWMGGYGSHGYAGIMMLDKERLKKLQKIIHSIWRS